MALWIEKRQGDTDVVIRSELDGIMTQKRSKWITLEPFLLLTLNSFVSFGALLRLYLADHQFLKALGQYFFVTVSIEYDRRIFFVFADVKK